LLFVLSMSVLGACSFDEAPPNDTQPGGDPPEKSANNLPDVNAGDDETFTQYVSEITLTGHYSDVETDVADISAMWTQVGGPPAATLVDPTTAETTVQFGAFTESPAQFTFLLTATDSEGASSSDEVVITIPKPQLIIDAGDDLSVNSGDVVNLHADVSYPDAEKIQSIVWEVVSNTVTIDPSGTDTTDVQFTAPPVSVATSVRFDVTVTMVIDDESFDAIDTVSVTINPAGTAQNNPPVANAKQDRTVMSGDTVTITGTGADSDGSISAYLWEQVDNAAPAIQLGSANTATVSFVAPTVNSATTIVLLLTVTDNLGVTGTDEVAIRINPASGNNPPVANAGGDQSVVAGESITITGSGSDSDGNITSYAWSRVAGPMVTFNPANTAVVSFTAPSLTATQTVTLQLTVADNDGATDSDEVDITILPANRPPSVAAGVDRLANVGQEVALTATASDDDGTIETYKWTNETADGPIITFSADTNASVSFVAPEVTQRTSLTLRVTVTDNDGAIASADVIVTINASPIANAGTDQQVSVGTVVTLNGNGTDADGTIGSYLWSQSGTPAVLLTSADAASSGFTAPQVDQPTVLTFQLTVTDNDGATASDVVTVRVIPPANQPVAHAGDDQAANPGDTVTMAGSGEVTDGTITGYLWEHTPGQNQEPAIDIPNPQSQSIEFTAPEVTEPTALTFTLTVTNDSGATASDTVVVMVYPLATLSGTITVAGAMVTDSDVNDPVTTPVPNDTKTQFQHIPNPATVGGYVNRAGVGPTGISDNDVVDVYHVSMAPGQVVNVYIGESYFVFDNSEPGVTQPVLTVYLTDEAGVPVYTNEGSSGILSLQVPNSQSTPPSAMYEINLQAGGGAAFSYVLTVGSGAMLQSEGWSMSDDFVPGELIVEFNDAPSAPAINSPAQNKTAQAATALAQRATSIGMQALAGAPDRSMLMSLGDATVKANTFSVLGIADRPVVANNVLQAKLDTILAAAALKQRADVKSVRLNYIYHATAVPNDNLYPRQWHYPLINLPQAWDTTTGSPDVTVAVIDTGILSNHPDIDSNRMVDGYDFIRSASNAGDGNGIDSNPEDPGDGGGVRASSFHGTHVAGTIGANTNNSIGVAGVAWQTNIMPLRVLGINGGTEYDIEQAIRYAAQLDNDSNTVPSRKADIINLSLGGPTNTSSAPQAFRLAREAGVIIVAAAGNDGSNQPSAPAAYNGVVSVSAVTINKQRASYSNFGSTIDVAAPGGNYSDTNGDGLADAVWSTKGSDGRNGIQYTYNYAAGTSMAAPHVAGVVALMKSVYPDLTPDIFDNMLASGDLTQDLGASGRDNNYGYGLIDAQKAVAAAVSAAGGTPAPADPAILAVTPEVLNFGSQITAIEITVSNNGAGTLTINNITEDSGGWLSITPVSVDTQGLGLYSVSVNRNILAQGIHSATISVSSDNGTIDMPVSMQVFPTQVISDAGPQVIELIDINTQQTVQALHVVPNNGKYDFSFSDVRLGVYHVRSSSDLDNDGTLCELGESCGAYPTLDSSAFSDVHVDGGSFDINGLDFETGFTINVIAQ
jgi:serine protease